MTVPEINNFGEICKKKNNLKLVRHPSTVQTDFTHFAEFLDHKLKAVLIYYVRSLRGQIVKSNNLGNFCHIEIAAIKFQNSIFTAENYKKFCFGFLTKNKWQEYNLKSIIG